MRHYFDLDEVNALIPDLEAHFRVMLELHLRVHQLYQGLRRKGVDPERAFESRSGTEGAAGAERSGPERSAGSRAAAAGQDPGPSPDLQRARAMAEALVEAINDEVSKVRALGGEVKGLDPGLVDFHAQHHGRDVLLCWRFGERRVEYFHDLESGFAGRQAIDPEDPPGKPKLH